MLVGIAGRMQSGKTTLAGLITERNTAAGITTAQLNFADPIRAVVGAISGVDPRLLHLQYVKYKNFVTKGEFILPQDTYTFREALQKIGMLFQDGFGKNFWTNMWQRDYTTIMAKHNYKNPDQRIMVLAADVRFQSEVDLINTLGGRMVYLTADDCPVSDHPSERLDLSWPKDVIRIHNTKDGTSDWVDIVAEQLRITTRIKGGR